MRVKVGEVLLAYGISWIDDHSLPRAQLGSKREY